MSAETNHVEFDPVLMIVGDRAAPGPIMAELSPHYQRWMNDFSMLRTLRGTAPLPVTAEAAAAIVDDIARQSDQASFVIYERDRMRPYRYNRDCEDY